MGMRRLATGDCSLRASSNPDVRRYRTGFIRAKVGVTADRLYCRLNSELHLIFRSLRSLSLSSLVFTLKCLTTTKLLIADAGLI